MSSPLTDNVTSESKALSVPPTTNTSPPMATNTPEGTFVWPSSRSVTCRRLHSIAPSRSSASKSRATWEHVLEPAWHSVPNATSLLATKDMWPGAVITS
eukprot:987240-Rhodomonas_salina.1